MTEAHIYNCYITTVGIAASWLAEEDLSINAETREPSTASRDQISLYQKYQPLGMHAESRHSRRLTVGGAFFRMRASSQRRASDSSERARRGYIASLREDMQVTKHCCRGRRRSRASERKSYFGQCEECQYRFIDTYLIRATQYNAHVLVFPEVLTVR